MSTLYVIGIGPGDPELLTLKALRILKEVPVVFVPKGKEEGTSLALSIVRRVVDLKNKEIRELHFPMVKTKDRDSETLLKRWDSLSQELIGIIKENDAVFLTLGDPCLYSTFFYLYDRLYELMPSLTIEIIPGVSSINASASRAGISLGLANEKIAIIPTNYEDFDDSYIKKFDTIVFIKVDRVFERLRDFLSKHGLLKNSIYISRVFMDDEKIIRDLSEVKKEDLNYFSMVITTKGLGEQHYFQSLYNG